MNSIVKRKSVRSFNGNDLTAEQKELILKYIADERNMAGINGNKIRIVLHEVYGKKGAEISTHGIITDAPAFLIVSCKNEKDVMLDLGYVFEKLVLYIEEIGLNTCWLGGVFDVEELKKKTDISEDEFIPIISPVGVKAINKLPKEIAIRKFVDADKRMDFDRLFFENSFCNVISDQKLRDVLEMIRLAPSASNKQPWRVLIDDKKQIHFFIERTKDYGKKGIVVVDYDIQMVDIGIALAHFELASGKKDYYKANLKIELLSEYSEYVISVK